MGFIKKKFTLTASIILTSSMSFSSKEIKQNPFFEKPKSAVSDLSSIEQAVQSAREDVGVQKENNDLKAIIAKQLFEQSEVFTGKLSMVYMGYDFADANFPSTKYFINSVTFNRVKVHQVLYSYVDGHLEAKAQAPVAKGKIEAKDKNDAKDKNEESRLYDLRQMIESRQGHHDYSVVIPGKLDELAYNSTSLEERTAIYAGKDSKKVNMRLENTGLEIGKEYIFFAKYVNNSRTRILTGKLPATDDNKKAVSDAVKDYYNKKK